LLAVDVPQFRKLADQGGTGDAADTRDALQDFLLAAPLLIAFDQLGVA
jgi:hypothetical protein